MKEKRFNIEELSGIIFSLFPEEIIRKYETNNLPLREQFIKSCEKKHLTFSRLLTKKQVKIITLDSIYENREEIKGDTFDFSIFVFLFM